MLAFTAGLFVLHQGMTIDIGANAGAERASPQVKRDQIRDDLREAIDENARAPQLRRLAP